MFAMLSFSGTPSMLGADHSIFGGLSEKFGPEYLSVCDHVSRLNICLKGDLAFLEDIFIEFSRCSRELKTF
jgi:hypothetical protein